MARPDKLPKVLTEEEAAALLDRFNLRYWTPHRNRTMALTMLEAGLRVSEVVALQLDHIDLTRRKLTVRDGKGGKDRMLPITPDLADALSAWLDRRPEEAPADTPYVFPTRNGNPVDPSGVWRFVKREAEKAGVSEFERVSPHTLRHTFATEFYRQTKDIRVLQEALGHADVSTTQIYAHIAGNDLEEAFARFRPVEAA